MFESVIPDIQVVEKVEERIVEVPKVAVQISSLLEARALLTSCMKPLESLYERDCRQRRERMWLERERGEKQKQKKALMNRKKILRRRKTISKFRRTLKGKKDRKKRKR